MTKRSKNYRSAAQKIVDGVLYSPLEAMHLTKETSTMKFDATVEVTFRLGVDPRKADQAVHGTANLPYGTGKAAKALVLAVGPRAQEAIDTEAGETNGGELIGKAIGGYIDFGAAVATPDLIGKVSRPGRVLGPRGLMPNPKTGTVMMDVAKTVPDTKGSHIELCVDKNGNLSFVVGKASPTPEQPVENYVATQEETLRLRPSTSKDRYLPKGTVVTAMGPGIPLDTSKTHNLTPEDPS